MSNLPSYTNLQRLAINTLPIFASLKTDPSAIKLATRFAHAYPFLSTLLNATPAVGLLILSPADWSSYAHAAFPSYGLTHYDHKRQLIITGVEVGDFWQPLLDMMQRMTNAQQHELAQVYGLRNGWIDLTAHVDTYVVHDLGHAFHLQADYWFPRRWLMEYFADLCAYTYIAACEPAQLPALETFLRALKTTDAEPWPLRTLSDFDAYYGKSEMRIENYLWFHGHLFAVARQEYQAAGQQALQQMWQTFVLGNIQAVSDEQLTTILQPIQPHLAHLLTKERERCSL